jgi:ribosomal protein S18 acetylase RimI-like enzyme
MRVLDQPQQRGRRDHQGRLPSPLGLSTAAPHDAKCRFGRVLIRPATPEDAEATARIHVSSWAAAYTLRGPSLEQRLDLHRRFPPSFVAEVDGEIAGFVGVGASRDPDAEGELYLIYVDPAQWGSGIGRELIRAAEARLRELGYRHVVLWVLDENPRARRFYEAAGWRADGRRRPIEFLGQTVPEVRYAKQL